MDSSGFEHVSREEAKQLVEEADRGLLITIDAEAVPYIGSEPPDEREIEARSAGYRFGMEETDG